MAGTLGGSRTFGNYKKILSLPQGPKELFYEAKCLLALRGFAKHKSVLYHIWGTSRRTLMPTNFKLGPSKGNG